MRATTSRPSSNRERRPTVDRRNRVRLRNVRRPLHEEAADARLFRARIEGVDATRSERRAVTFVVLPRRGRAVGPEWRPLRSLLVKGREVDELRDERCRRDLGVPAHCVWRRGDMTLTFSQPKFGPASERTAFVDASVRY